MSEMAEDLLRRFIESGYDGQCRAGSRRGIAYIDSGWIDATAEEIAYMDAIWQEANR